MTKPSYSTNATEAKGIVKTFSNGGAYVSVPSAWKGKEVRVRLIEEPQRTCQFSGCKETKDVNRFWSYEEGSVWLCKTHTDLNVKNKTGYPES